jgi:D-3-phosphoglycerate dehydrogenase
LLTAIIKYRGWEHDENTIRGNFREAKAMNDRLKVALTDHNYPSLDLEREILEKENIELLERICRSEDELIEHTKDADGIMNLFFPITRRAIEHLQKCKVISVYGTGTNQIDLKAASERGILVLNVPDYCFDEVATHAVALILNIARQITNYGRLVKEGDWAYMKLKLHRFCGRTVGIVGLGAIGRSVARKLSGFDLKLIGYDPYVSDESFPSLGVEKVGIDDLFRESDFVTLHMPLTDETRNMVSTELLGLMKPTAYLINVSRGAVLDEKALLCALNESRIAGVAMDVLCREPPSVDDEIVNHPNSWVTPHVAWYSEESFNELRTRVAQAAADVLRNRVPKNIVNRHLLRL